MYFVLLVKINNFKELFAYCKTLSSMSVLNSIIYLEYKSKVILSNLLKGILY